MNSVLPRELQIALSKGYTDKVLFAEKLLGMPLHDGQKAFLREGNSKVNVLVPANRWGKASALTEPVLTPTGWKLMGDIKVGDEVITADGSTTVVNAVWPQPKQDIYRLTFDDGAYTDVTRDHLWKVMTGSSRFKKNYDEDGRQYPNSKYQSWSVFTTGEILDKWGPTPTKHTAVTIPVVDPVEFNHQDITVDPYTLGVLLGDGSVKNEYVTFTSDDPEIVERVRESYEVRSHASKYAYGIPGLASKLRDIGVMGHGAETKSVPENYLLNSSEVRLWTLRGLMDTDGSINTKNKKIEFCTISEQLAKDVQFLVQSFGGKCRISSRYTHYTKNGIKKIGKLSYRLSIDIRVNPFYLSRKAKLFDEKKKFYTPNRILKSIEVVDQAPAQCITVDHPSHLYVTRDFIVTHNSVTVAIKHIHKCFYKVGVGRGNTQAHARSNYLTANLAPHSDATKPVFDAVLAILRSSFPIPQEGGGVLNNECLIGWFLDEDHIRTSTPYYIPFNNNSAILFRSTGEDKGDSIQGKSFGYISYDEGGRSNHLEYELDSNIIPRLADLNGELDIVSTPDQRSASILHHYELFQKGMNHEAGYYSQEGGITDNIFLLRNNPTYIEDEQARLRGNPILDQVLFGKFVFAGDNLYPSDQIHEATDESLDAGVRYEPGHQYMIGIDTAMGEDEMVYTVLDITSIPYRVVRIIGAKGNSKSPQMHQNDFIDLFDSYNKDNNVRVILETWNGESARFYQDMPPNIQAVTKCFGSWQPPGITAKMIGRNPRNVRKAEILIALQKILANREIKIPNNADLVKQLSIYREEDNKLKTDRVMSLALVVWLATDGKPKNQTIEFQEIDW